MNEAQISNLLPEDMPPLIRRFVGLYQLSKSEINILKEMHEQVSTFDENITIHYEGERQADGIIILKGWAYRFTILKNGNRQVINYYLPGDIISPFALVQPSVNYSVKSLTSMEVCIFKPEYLLRMFSTEPRLGLIYGHILGKEDSISAEQIVRLGCRSAYQRTAHLLLELYYRLKRVDRTSEGSYLFPLTQELLADTLGMSFVHMNRTLRKLRINNLIEIESNKMNLLDIDKLISIAEFK